MTTVRLIQWMNFSKKLERNETKQNKSNAVEFVRMVFFYPYLVLMLCYFICYCQFVKCFRNYYVYIIHLIFEITDRQCEQMRSIGLPVSWPMTIVRYIFRFLRFALFFPLYFHHGFVLPSVLLQVLSSKRDGNDDRPATLCLFVYSHFYRRCFFVFSRFR